MNGTENIVITEDGIYNSATNQYTMWYTQFNGVDFYRDNTKLI
jgi:hypothetical protein